jgi:hypothetical protein
MMPPIAASPTLTTLYAMPAFIASIFQPNS